MTTGHVVLGLLSRGQQHGYDLKRQHDELFPAVKEIAFGQVYAALGRLRDKGFVEEAARERVDGPERTAYRITDAGRAELASWLAQVEPLPEHAANPVATKVTLLLLAEGAGRTVEHLVRERAVRVARMRELTAAKHEPGTTPGGPRGRPHPGAPGRRPALDRVGSPADPRPRGGNRMTNQCSAAEVSPTTTTGRSSSRGLTSTSSRARSSPSPAVGVGQVDPAAGLAGIIVPTSGSVLLAGRPARAGGAGRAALRRQSVGSCSSTARWCPS
jgi:DNA-binding PadR family transcriptional regulator